MSVIPVRRLDQVGIIKDVDPYDLPLNAFSDGVNIIFDERGVSRTPVARSVVDPLWKAPIFVAGYRPASGADETLVCAKDGTMRWFKGGTMLGTDAGAMTPAGDSHTSWTRTTLSDVFYINRRESIPMRRLPGSDALGNLEGWDTGWRCHALRAFKDLLVALNVTKGGTQYGAMVKWSDIAPVGAVPPSWDHTVTTNSAGENVIGELDSGIVDGLALGDNFIIYGEQQVWTMSLIPGPFVFAFRKLFDEGGLINQNSVVEYEARHYVFGTNDIYVHDGARKRSIVDLRVRNFVYSSLQTKNRDRCFVIAHPGWKLIMFCYVSDHRAVYGPDPGSGCNFAAVFAPQSNTWSFMDMPWLVASDLVNIDKTANWDETTTPWDEMGGSWQDQSDPATRHIVAGCCACGLATRPSTNRLLGLDFLAGRLTYPVDLELLEDSFVERIGIDLDEISELQQSALLTSIWPQCYSNEPGALLRVYLGSSMAPATTPTLVEAGSIDPTVADRIDYVIDGKYLAMRWTMESLGDFRISGYDLDIQPNGAR